MARRRLLTREALARHYEPSVDDREITRHFTLSQDDFDLIATRRGETSRLGFAMVMLYMRWPGRVLESHRLPFCHLLRGSSTCPLGSGPITDVVTKPVDPIWPT